MIHTSMDLEEIFGRMDKMELLGGDRFDGLLLLLLLLLMMMIGQVLNRFFQSIQPVFHVFGVVCLKKPCDAFHGGTRGFADLQAIEHAGKVVRNKDLAIPRQLEPVAVLGCGCVILEAVEEPVGEDNIAAFAILGE
jgi:hypothetical protein